ncbi:MAG: xanthine dehydrogenase family protein molybdopterin-binding subunit [Candidatus Dormibacteria bacterium]
MSGRWVGRSQSRREDQRLVTGRGAYLDDLAIAGCLHVAFVRSPVPHARIEHLELAPARRSPGVIDIITAADLEGTTGTLPLHGTPLPDGFRIADVPMPILAGKESLFAGEALAAVAAESRPAAVDAAELLIAELEPLPSTGRPREALRRGPIVQAVAPDNVLFSYSRSAGDVSGQFAQAARTIRASFEIPRLQAAPLETRGCVASFDRDAQLLTLWCSSQDPHRPRLQLANVFGLPLEKVRVVVPNVGGAFGAKGGLPPEYAVAAVLAMRTGRPVKWVETRSESFLAAYQGRGMEADCELAVDSAGRFLGFRAHMVFDVGAYLLGHTAVVATTTCSLATGAYAIPAVEVHVVGAATNKVPTGPYRGAGRPEATFLIERMVDLAASELGIDPAEIRRRNLLGPTAFPYLAATGTEYDSGDYPGLLQDALDRADYPALQAARSAARAQGRLLGVGLAVAVESSGNGGWETATARLAADGHVLILPGSSDHGQGHATTFSQIAADAMGLAPTQIEVRGGDSSEVPLGVGTFGSRSVTVGGSAILLAVEDLQRRCLAWGAHLLDVPEDHLQWEAGAVVSPETHQVATLSDIARAAQGAASEADLPDLEGAGRFQIRAPAIGSSAAVVALEVDPETGSIRLQRMVVIDDAGTIINPLLAEGQVVGSAIQGVAAAIFEEVSHDPDGQPLTEGFMSYEIPTMPDLDFELITAFRPTRSPLSPLGTKGVGETGCIVVPAAIANAVADALAPRGIGPGNPPYSPERVWRRLRGDRG